MVHDGKTINVPRSDVTELGASDVDEMTTLAELTEPGPFGRRTGELGDYIGIKRNGELVAMAGERLRLPGYLEVSAVCTHPEHSGRGYASLLVSELVRRIQTSGKVPFLHVRAENARAVELYKRLGFIGRMTFQLGCYRRIARSDLVKAILI